MNLNLPTSQFVSMERQRRSMKGRELAVKGKKKDMEMLYDKDIREPLFDFLEETYGKVRILEEKMMGRSRADVVMVTSDSLYGIEIKSDADTYARLYFHFIIRYFCNRNQIANGWNRFPKKV